jgi:hypothetical protein
MRYLINFADGGFEKSRLSNSMSGLQYGFDSVIQWGKADIDEDFWKENEEILSSKRGAGYWLWKPYLIRETLDMCSEGDLVFYADAGSFFFRDVSPLLNRIEDEKVVCFQLAGGHKEGEWTRKSVIEKLGADPEEVRGTEQRMASFIGVVKNADTINIIDEYLLKCTDPDLIMDKDREEDEFEEFKDHRHDQSIWSVLTKKNGITMLPDPTQWGRSHGTSSVEDFYINHHRSKS